MSKLKYPVKCQIGDHDIKEDQEPVWSLMASGMGCRCGGPHEMKCCTPCYLEYEKKRKENDR